VLLNRRLGQPRTELLDVRRHVQGLDIENLREALASHQFENSSTAWKYARRVLGFRILAAKYSMKRLAAAPSSRRAPVPLPPIPRHSTEPGPFPWIKNTRSLCMITSFIIHDNDKTSGSRQLARAWV